MTKSRILNVWQRDNLSILSPITLLALKQGDWRNTPSSLLCCVSCGKHRITTPILAFFNYQGERVLCYDCQLKSKPAVPTTRELTNQTV